jgi:hypothetical protein
VSKVPIWWEYLNHGGMLIGPAQLEEHYLEPISSLSSAAAENLRRAVVRIGEGESSLSPLLDTVLEDLLGLEAHEWIKGPGAEWSQVAITKEKIRPRRVWTGPNGAILPVFDTRSVLGATGQEKPPRIGIGRGRQMVSRVVEWLRQDRRSKIALLTTGRQWRLIHAGETFDAWCEWDTALWFTAGEPGPQVEALRRLLGRDSLMPPGPGEKSKLATAILDSRRGEADLTAALGERVRQAVEHLIQASTGALDAFVGNDNRENYNEIYIAATRMVMRCVVALFAEAREMLPVSEVVYHSSYGIRGLREQLDQTYEDTLRESHSGWPRLIALFRLLFEGSDHGQFPVVKYGGRLFEPGDAASNDPVLRAIAVLENSDGPSDLELRQILDLLGKTFTKLRYRRGARPFAIPVDFSAMDTEYIGILYEGLLDFNLKRAPEPIVFLQIGDYPALPWSSLRDMEQQRLEALLENLKKKSTIQLSEDEGDEDDSGGDDDSNLVGDSEEPPEFTEAAEEVPSAATSDALDAEVFEFAVKAVKAAGIVKLGRGKRTPERLKAFEEEARAKAKSLFRVVRKGEWYLVRFGNTRKGSGTFYTKPQLAAPTVRRTLQPLCYLTDGTTPRTPDEILNLKICDPSMGSGSFLISSVRYMTEALLKSLYQYDRVEKKPGEWICRIADGLAAELVRDDTVPVPAKHEDAEARLRARLRRYVVERCIYGVDIDDMAVELGRMALWIETMDRELPFGFLDHKIRPGNALVGCWFDRFEDYPATAWLREGGDKDYKPVNGGRANWTRAIAARLRDHVKPALQRYIVLNKQSVFQFQGGAETPAQVHDRAMKLLDEMHALPVQDVEERRRKYESIRNAPVFQALIRAFDLWCALWFWPGQKLSSAPLPSDLLNPSSEVMEQVDTLKRSHRSYRFFHWELEFPDVYGGGKRGFDAVVGNPPWEIQKPNSKEFFSNLDPLYRGYGKTEAEAEQKKWFAKLPQVELDWLAERARLKGLNNWVRNVGRPFGDYTRQKADGEEEWIFAMGRYDASADLHSRWRKLRSGRSGYADGHHPFRYQGSADLNTYKMFLETGYRLLRDGGRLGFIAPSGVYSDKGSTLLRGLFLDEGKWEWLLGFENREGIFDIHRSFKFAPMIVEKGGKTKAIRAAFMRRSLSDWEDAEKFVLDYPRERILQFSPKSKALLELMDSIDWKISISMYERGEILGAHTSTGWHIDGGREFHLTDDAEKFPKLALWEDLGYAPDEYGHWLKGNWQPSSGARQILSRPEDLVLSRCGQNTIRVTEIDDVALPFYQGAMVHQFDWCASAYRGTGGKPWQALSFEAKTIRPKHLMSLNDYASFGRAKRGLKLVFRDITNTTNERTMICGPVPDCPCGNTLPILGHWLDDEWRVAGLLNSYCFDWLARKRLTGTHMNLFILNELAALRPAAIMSSLTPLIAGLMLPRESFAHTWLPFASPQRSWRSLWAITDHERLRLRSILDATIGFLYGLSENEFRRVLYDCDHPVEHSTSDEFTRKLARSSTSNRRAGEFGIP